MLIDYRANCWSYDSVSFLCTGLRATCIPSFVLKKIERGQSNFTLYHKLVSRVWLSKKLTFETWTNLTPLYPFPVLGR